MGLSMRTNACLDFDLAPLVWKLICDPTLVESGGEGGASVDVETKEPSGAASDMTIADVALVDYKLGTFLGRIRDFSPSAWAATNGESGMDAEAAFTACFGNLLHVMPDPWVPVPSAAVGQHGTPVVHQMHSLPLFRNGGSMLVTYANRLRYIKYVMRSFLKLFSGPAAAMRRGLACVVPERALSLCGWSDLRRLVCGESDIDLEVLRKNTVYE
jgi:hypothetical protein